MLPVQRFTEENRPSNERHSSAGSVRRPRMPVKFPDHRSTQLQTLVTVSSSQLAVLSHSVSHVWPFGPWDLGNCVTSPDPISKRATALAFSRSLELRLGRMEFKRRLRNPNVIIPTYRPHASDRIQNERPCEPRCSEAVAVAGPGRPTQMPKTKTVRYFPQTDVMCKSDDSFEEDCLRKNLHFRNPSVLVACRKKKNDIEAKRSSTTVPPVKI